MSQKRPEASESEKQASGIARRDFFKLAGLSAGGAAAALVATSVPASAEPAGKTTARYRETAHIKTYYELAKF
jgi:hypothetical protein